MAKKNFEDALGRLEVITTDLEEGNLSLDDSLIKFEEGVKLAEYCGKRLDEAQQKVNLLLKKNGSLKPAPFESNQED